MSVPVSVKRKNTSVSAGVRLVSMVCGRNTSSLENMGLMTMGSVMSQVLRHQHCSIGMGNAMRLAGRCFSESTSAHSLAQKTAVATTVPTPARSKNSITPAYKGGKSFERQKTAKSKVEVIHDDVKASNGVKVGKKQLSPIEAAIQAFRFDKSRFAGAANALILAKGSDAKLDVQGLVLGIEACTMAKRTSGVLDAAAWAFAQLGCANVAGVGTYENMMVLYSRCGELVRAKQTLDSYLALGFSLSSAMISPYIIMVARHGKDEHMKEATELYQSLRVRNLVLFNFI